MDLRAALENGSQLTLGGRVYRIGAVAGRGANAIVYHVAYADGLSTTPHAALLKELYPAVAGVRREGGALTVAPEAQALFALHRQSFENGNDAHLRQLRRQAGRVSGNIDSYQAFGTLYTLLPCHGGQSLDALLTQTPRAGAEAAARRLLALLDALAPFHEAGLLHLDVSADNLLVLPLLHGFEADIAPMLLIDYNGVWSPAGQAEPPLSSKAGYSAPEVRLRDQNALCEATDLFAACAVFFEMLTGRRLSEAECCGQFHARMSAAADEACAGLPQTARLWAVRLLRKGLAPLPARRYASIAALRADVCELLARIQKRGVTHAALWEAAVSSLPPAAPPEGLLPLTVTVAGHARRADAAWLAASAGHLLLTGEGGGGKTTLLAALHRDLAARYSPQRPVCHYIPLYRWQGRAPFLLRCLAEGLTPIDCAATQADVYAALTALLQTPLPGGGPVLILLLDGLNEAGARPEGLFRDVAAIARLGGVRIIATSRNAGDLRRLPEGFAHAALNPPADADVAAALQAAGLWAATPPAMLSMLANPMLLAYYRDTWAAWRQSGQPAAAHDPAFATPEALLNAYLAGQVARFEALHRHSEAACLRARYAAEHLLPKLAAAMRLGPALPQAQAAAIVARDYRALRSAAFGRAYPAYLGRSRLLLQGVHSAAEWYDVALREGLCEQLAMLGRGRGGEVALRHDSFRPVLRRAARSLTARLRAQFARRVGAWALAGMLLLGALAAGRVWVFPPMSRVEQAAVQELYNAQLSAMLEVSEVLKAAQNVRDVLAGAAVPPRVMALLPKTAATLGVETVPWQRAGLSREAWAAVLAAPQEASHMFLGALLMLAPAYAQPHTPAYRAQRLADYDAFAAAYRAWYLLALHDAYAQADDAARDGFYQTMKAAPALRETFITTAQPQGDAAALRAQLESARAAWAQTALYPLAAAQAQQQPDGRAMADALAQAVAQAVAAAAP
jgi:hypothetical protein